MQPASNVVTIEQLHALPGVQLKLMLVTPEMAKEWLKRNIQNRTPNHRRVKLMAEAIQNGQFLPILQPIMFDEDGNLMDGQHRLLAIIEANQATYLWVATGVPKTHRMCIDQGMPRGVVGALQVMYGNQFVSKQEMGVLRAMLFKGVTREMLSPHKALQYLQWYKDAITFTLRHLQGKDGICRSAVQGAVARAYFYYSNEELERFCNILMTSTVQEPKDSTVCKLTEWILRNKQRGGDKFRHMMYMVTERALVAYHHGEILKSLRPLLQEAFPLPHETNTEPA